MKYVQIVATLATGLALNIHAATYQFMDDSSEVAQKAKALLDKMTLEEKVGQMIQADSNAALHSTKGDIAKYYLGSVLSGGGADPHYNDALSWKKYAELHKGFAAKTRLQIPVVYGIDAVHGHNNIDGATIFPHNIALGATRNLKLIEESARVVANEVAGTGIGWTFAPCITVPRNERWGRTYEGFSEESQLVTEMGLAYIRGLQKNNLAQKDAVLACAKHFLGDGGTTNGKDQGDTKCDEQSLRKIHLTPYIEAVKAGVGSIMVSYNSWNGKKLHGHKYLVNDVLKDELNFKGFTVSDWAAIDQISKDYSVCVEQSINAGLDMIMIPASPNKANNYRDCFNNLKKLVGEKKIPMSRINDAVYRILKVKYEMGLFDGPKGSDKLFESIGSKEHRAVARQCVRESAVLLKNDSNLLPLKKDGTRILLTGESADNLGHQCGGWTISWQGASGDVTEGTTIREGMKQVAPNADIRYNPYGAIDGIRSDVAVIAIGEKPFAEFKGDRKDLSLNKAQVKLVKQLKKKGLKTVVLLVVSRPVIIDKIMDVADAVMVVWLPGTEGAGVADVLFGDYAPVGKLPVTWPVSMDQIPINIGDADYKPLYEFGYGLTYNK